MLRTLIVVLSLAIVACAETPRAVITAAPAATTPAVSTTAPVGTTAPRGTTAPPSGGATSATPSAVATASASATVTPRPSASGTPSTSSAALPPMPPLPSLPTGATVADRGLRTFTIAAGEIRTIDASIALPAPGPCPSFVWAVAWRATGALSATVVTQTGRIDTGTGSWGTAEMGCAWIELRNPGSVTVSGELAYITGSR